PLSIVAPLCLLHNQVSELGKGGAGDKALCRGAGCPRLFPFPKKSLDSALLNKQTILNSYNSTKMHRSSAPEVTPGATPGTFIPSPLLALARCGSTAQGGSARCGHRN